jgi:RNA polymerase sigma-70 factor (ECF subfamily)
VGEDSLYAEAEIGTRLSGANPLKNTSNKELGGELARALAGLSEDHRSVLLLREIEAMSYEEIAETLSIPRGTVMSRLFHARKNMQRLLRPFLGLTDGVGLDGTAEEGGENPSADAEKDREDPSGKRRPT